jgi:hypothetical protein
MIRAALIAAVLVLSAPAVATAQESVYKPFKTPSGRIFCAFMRGDELPPQIRCDMTFLNDRAAVIKRRGRARIVKVTDAVGDPDAPVLAYGKTRRFGRLRCASRRSGLTCRSTLSGHGFTISRERQRTF